MVEDDDVDRSMRTRRCISTVILPGPGFTVDITDVAEGLGRVIPVVDGLCNSVLVGLPEHFGHWQRLF